MPINKNFFFDRLSRMGPVSCYILPAAFFVFMGIAFGPFGSYLFEEVMIIPCVLFLREMFSQPLRSDAKKAFFLSSLLFCWFFLLQILRDLAFFEVYPFSTYFCSYFFAFPMASLIQDSTGKKALKLFFTVFIAASVCHVITTLLMLLDAVPAYFTQYHAYWDGTRLHSFWHPNMTACFLMFGVGACLVFLQDTADRRTKAALLAAIALFLIPMALTNCRTVIILTGGLLGGTAFFSMVRGSWKRVLPGLAVACAIVLLVYTGASSLYSFHSNVLAGKHTMEPPRTAAGVFVITAEAASPTESSEQDMSQEVTTPPMGASDINTSLGTSSEQKTLAEDLGNLNNRTMLWKSALKALFKNGIYPIIGVDDPGRHMSYYSDFPDVHTHNSWMETLLGLGIPGFAIAMVFTLLTLWNGIIILLKHNQDVWKRTTAMLTLCMLMASFMEPYLFLPPKDYYLYNFIFLLCAGYLLHWQEEDNQKALQAIRKFLPI